MQSLLFLVLACLSLKYSNGFCNDNTNCVACTTTTSWSGYPCRWCPRTSTCHAYGSVIFNRCMRRENIVNHRDCDRKVYREYQYDKNLAFKMIQLCALAYSYDVSRYIPKASEVGTFQLVKQVTNPCSGSALCSGFVAVSHKEKAIAIAFRGTQHFEQLMTIAKNVLIVKDRRSFTQGGGKVLRYFLDAFEIVWNDLEDRVYEEIKKYPSYKVWVTGHSLGGALASFASTLIMFKSKKTKDNLMLYTFGQPRVGNYDYASAHDSLVPQSFRVTHYRDIVVHLPMCKDHPCSTQGKYYHHGIEVYYGSEIMTKYSSYEVCEGLPHNEDVSCSNSAWSRCYPVFIKSCIDDHKQYFGISVGTWWKNQVPVDCVPSAVSKSEDDCWKNASTISSPNGNTPTTSAPNWNTASTTSAPNWNTASTTFAPNFRKSSSRGLIITIIVLVVFAVVGIALRCFWKCYQK